MQNQIDFVPIMGYYINQGNCTYFILKERDCMGYLSISQVAEKWGIKQRRIRVLCAEGRIEGACKAGAFWLIPEDAEKPKDERIKSGKYIKNSEVV